MFGSPNKTTCFVAEQLNQMKPKRNDVGISNSHCHNVFLIDLNGSVSCTTICFHILSIACLSLSVLLKKQSAFLKNLLYGNPCTITPQSWYGLIKKSLLN